MSVSSLKSSRSVLSLSGSTESPAAARAQRDRAERSQHVWALRLADVESFIGKTGHAPRHGSAHSDERSLAGWLNHQKVKRNAGELSAPRIDLLETIAPSATTRKSRPFEARVDDLRLFYQKVGRIPRNSISEEKSLSQWLLSERMKFKRNELSLDRQQMLAEIPGALDTRSNASTDAMLSLALAWCDEHGHLPRPSFSSGRQLSDPEAEEQRIASWMRNHSRTGVVAVETAETLFRREAIQELYSQFPTRAEAAARMKFEEIRDVLHRLDYIPSSTDYPKVSAWLARFREKRRGGEALEPGARSLLEYSDGLLSYREFLLVGRVSELEEFILDHDRLPGFAQSAVLGETSLAFWLKRRLDGSRGVKDDDEIHSRINDIIDSVKG